MTMKMIMTIMFAVFATLSVGTLNDVFAEGEATKYKMADDVSAVLTFEFRDGIETHSFPVFKMTSDFVSNVGTTFNVQGVVDEAPHLHQALDDAFKYRMMTTTGGSSFEYDYRFFDVYAEISKNGESIRTVDYYNCEVLDYKIETEKDDYESYGFYEKVGFAIVDDIDFRCGGVVSGDKIKNQPRSSTSLVAYDYGSSPFKFAHDARTTVTFEFDEGTETMEFPIFELTAGFEEGNDSGPSFHVEGIVTEHPLLDNAINQARKTSGLASSYNTDFEASVKFTNNGEFVRGLDFVDCTVSSFFVDTYQDKEEGYTGKRGFAVIEKIDFTCAGMTPQNPTYDKMQDGKPVWSNTKMYNEYTENTYNMGTGPKVIATFTFDNGQEVIDLPVFEQGTILDKANPTFELVGVPGSYPLLYQHVDDMRKNGQKVSGTNSISNLFDVDVSLIHGEKTIRGFNYADCRNVDYVIKTQHDKEESFFKGFSLTNEFHLECKGYHPNNPIYDEMFETYEKGSNRSTNDLKNTDDWAPGFYVE
ncbi:hypothetical protein [Nitrosopumilus sp.]|uniref:hypothetical protein n=1 Tax=Nitrosopumilus sp. TaxID=2024843 RepID=UPI003B5B33AC